MGMHQRARDAQRVVNAGLEALAECEGETLDIKAWRLAAAMARARQECTEDRARATVRPPRG